MKAREAQGLRPATMYEIAAMEPSTTKAEPSSAFAELRKQTAEILAGDAALEEANRQFREAPTSPKKEIDAHGSLNAAWDKTEAELAYEINYGFKPAEPEAKKKKEEAATKEEAAAQEEVPAKKEAAAQEEVPAKEEAAAKEEVPAKEEAAAQEEPAGK